MPLKTFENLTEEKKKNIIDVCIYEFAVNDYESASIARIIARLGLARGSFYRYFEHKADLYSYLYKINIKIVENLKAEYLSDQDKDFFYAWLNFGIALLKAEINHPMYLAFLTKVTQEQRVEIFGSRKGSKLEQRLDLFGKMIDYHRESGQIRKDISLEIESFFLINTREGIRQYLMKKYQLDFTDPDYHNNSFFKLDNHEIHKDLSGFIILLRDALENPQWRNRK